MRYRVEHLADACGLSVDTVRFYQTRGLLDPPSREGRVAWYTDAHRERLERIKELKDAGFTLAMIERVLAGDLDASEQALARAIAKPRGGGHGTAAGDTVAGTTFGEVMTRSELAELTGVSATLLEALEREDLLTPPDPHDTEPLYTASDAAFVQAGKVLLDSGVPLSELLDLARRHDAAMRSTATQAVDLFARFVRDPIRAGAADDVEFAQQTVDALDRMLPATTDLISHHFQRLLMDAARARLEAEQAGEEHGAQAHSAAGAASRAQGGDR